MNPVKDFFAGARGMQRAFSMFGPYRGAGIRVEHIADDFSEATVSMRLRWYNTNYVGTHFGGSLYSMVDPFYMLLLMNRLGRDYIVWDKAAFIDFIRPAKGKVSAHFVLTEQMLEDVRHNTADGNKYQPCWPVEIHNEAGELVARIDKTLYIRRKRSA